MKKRMRALICWTALQLYLFVALVVKMKFGKVVVAVGFNADPLLVFPCPAAAYGKNSLGEIGI